MVGRRDAADPGREGVAIGSAGHWRGSAGAEKSLVIQVLGDDGRQLTLTPAEFAKKYGWKNDPSKVTLGTITGPDPPQDQQ